MMRPMPSLPLSILLVALLVAALNLAPSRANQHAPAANFGAAWLGDFELIVEAVSGPVDQGAPTVQLLYTVPAGQTLIITDTQMRASGLSPFLLRDGQRVAEASGEFSPTNPPFFATRTSSSAGIYFPAGSEMQLEVPGGLQIEFLSLRGYFTAQQRWTAIRHP